MDTVLFEGKPIKYQLGRLLYPKILDKLKKMDTENIKEGRIIQLLLNAYAQSNYQFTDFLRQLQIDINEVFKEIFFPAPQ